MVAVVVVVVVVAKTDTEVEAEARVVGERGGGREGARRRNRGARGERKWTYFKNEQLRAGGVLKRGALLRGGLERAQQLPEAARVHCVLLNQRVAPISEDEVEAAPAGGALRGRNYDLPEVSSGDRVLLLGEVGIGLVVFQHASLQHEEAPLELAVARVFLQQPAVLAAIEVWLTRTVELGDERHAVLVRRRGEAHRLRTDLRFQDKVEAGAVR